jgi:hypothetical protein
MSVFQFCQHIAQYLEQMVVAQVIGDKRLKLCFYPIPVNMFVIKETIMLVDDAPQSLEVALGGVGIFLVAHTTGEQQKRYYQ